MPEHLHSLFVQMLYNNIVDSDFKQKIAKDSSSLRIIYGRRRVGKTELSLKFVAGKTSIYYLAQKLNIEQQVRLSGKDIYINFTNYF